MTRTRRRVLASLAIGLTWASVGGGCEGSGEPSATTPNGYSFVQDFELERRVLRIGLTSDESVDCLRARLPIEESVTWKSEIVEPALLEDLISLVRDDSRISSYRADTLAIECNEWNCEHPESCDGLQGDLHDACERSRPDGCTPDPESCVPAEMLEVCVPRATNGEFCYRPEAATSLEDTLLWRFSLSEDFVLSGDSRDLLDAFLEAHDACWNP